MGSDKLFSPRRVVVLPSEGLAATIDSTAVRDRALAQLRTLAANCKDIRPSVNELPYSPEKFGLCLAMMESMARHYHQPARALDWAAALCFREALSDYSICSGFGLVHQFQRPGEPDLEIDQPPFDGWLFLMPNGVDWSAIDNPPVYCLVSGVTATFSAGAAPRTWVTLGESIWKVVRHLTHESEPTFDNPNLANAAQALTRMKPEAVTTVFNHADEK